MTSEHDDERARRERAQRLRQAVQEIAGDGPRRPSSPRDFTEQRAREAAAEEREKVDPGGGQAAAGQRERGDPDADADEPERGEDA